MMEVTIYTIIEQNICGVITGNVQPWMMLNRTADSKQIRGAYLRLALCLHPDKATARHATAQQQDDVSIRKVSAVWHHARLSP